MINLGYVNPLMSILSDPDQKGFMQEMAAWEQGGKKGVKPRNVHQRKVQRNVDARYADQRNQQRNAAFNSAYRVDDDGPDRATRQREWADFQKNVHAGHYSIAEPPERRLKDGAPIGLHPTFKGGVDPSVRANQIRTDMKIKQAGDDAYRDQLDERRRLEAMDMAPPPQQAPAPGPSPTPSPAAPQSSAIPAPGRAAQQVREAADPVGKMTRGAVQQARSSKSPAPMDRKAKEREARKLKAKQYAEDRAERRKVVADKVRVTSRQTGTQRNRNRRRMGLVPSDDLPRDRRLEARMQMMRAMGLA